MNILIIGSGSREHAIAWLLSQSKQPVNLFVAPGNAGTVKLATNIPVKVPSLGLSSSIWRVYFQKILKEVRKKKIDLVVVQVEVPLAAGLGDFLDSCGILVFGPSKAAAKIEANKIWANDFMVRHLVPKPDSISLKFFDEVSDKLIKDFPVIKADGLAGGKGVKIASNVPEGRKILKKMMKDQVFGEAGKKVLLQKKIVGREVSIQAFSDGTNFALMPLACDYKKIGEGDKGENTGGIGCYSQPRWLEKKDHKDIKQIVASTIAGMKSEGRLFRGVIYPGAIKDNTGLKIIEYNCRLGNPEAQVLLPLLKSDLLEIMFACAHGVLDSSKVEWKKKASVAVVLCSGGYPDPEKTKIGFPILGLENIPKDVLVFHAGTAFDKSGQVVTSGGRVLTLVGLGKSIKEARVKVYKAVEQINFEGIYFRKDIALLD